jgi:xylulokinase
LDGLKGLIRPEQLYRINGNTLGNQFSLTKLKWLKQHRPDLYRQTDIFLPWSGLVAFMLGAEPRADYSLANRTLLFDLERRDWSEELLELADLDREKLPAALPSGVVIGTVAGAIASELGLLAGIPIISGGHDQCCNGVGCGVLAPGQAMYGMGTYLCLMPVFDQRPEASKMIERSMRLRGSTSVFSTTRVAPWSNGSATPLHLPSACRPSPLGRICMPHCWQKCRSS